ncbi:D-alanine--D-alanine ligase family protein [Glaciihabitans sp. UYNi722]|uniref:D-alanine--D-alanine ligase family protein n=1 Tax=Glaciihabitans sp. UYNi722 TaxID=3156344 RepID=UPI00339ACBD6
MKKIGIIFGGANSEHEVSCNSARSVASNLDPAQYEAMLLGIDRGGRWHRVESVDALADATDGTRFPDLDDIDVVFPVLHGRFGEDGTVQGLLELAGVPYVGCGVLASALAMDKLLAQRVLEASGIPTIPTHGVTADTVREAAEFAASVGFPLFVKPNRAGSSVGVSRVSSEDELTTALELALSHDTIALMQRAVEGDEVDLGVLQQPDGELIVGAPLRVLTADSTVFFDYTAKYTAGGAELEVPAQIPVDVAAQLVELAKLAFMILGCEGLARVDFFVGADGAITLNEVNTLPGLTAFSQYPRMWAAVGVTYPELLGRLIDRAAVAFAA